MSQNQCLGMRVRVRDSWQTSQQPERGCGVEDWADPIRWRWAGSQVKNKKQKNIWCGDGSAGRTCSHTHSQSRRTPDCTSAPAFSNELHTHVSLLVIRTKEASRLCFIVSSADSGPALLVDNSWQLRAEHQRCCGWTEVQLLFNAEKVPRLESTCVCQPYVEK